VLALKPAVRYHSTIVLPPFFGTETIADAPHRAVVLVSASDELTVTWSRYGAGERGPDLHVHREHTDAFYVLTGELVFEVGPGAERVTALAGTFVAVPPNVVHTFVNASDADATWLNFHAPDKGFAAYLRAARDGRQAAWDSFDPPADGGRPVTEVVVRQVTS
jgi:quercetin dioxygenase-like cupin family protein